MTSEASSKSQDALVSHEPAGRRTLFAVVAGMCSWLGRGLWRGAKCLLIALAVYIVILLVGLIPVNRDFESADAGVTLYVISNEVHADIIVPRKHAIHDWTDEFQDATFTSDVTSLTHLAFGWGDRGFYLHTPTWADLKFSTGANALLLPSSTCMHVAFTQPEYYHNAAQVTVSAEQYRHLVDYLQRSFKRNEAGRVQQIAGYAYGSHDAFFEAVGNYHLLNTCNSWAGRGLQAAGVCTPWLTPLPGSPMLYFPE